MRNPSKDQWEFKNKNEKITTEKDFTLKSIVHWSIRHEREIVEKLFALLKLNLYEKSFQLSPKNVLFESLLSFIPTNYDKRLSA